MNQPKILVVEDEKDCQLVLGAELRKKGYKILLAEDAVNAVAITQEEKPDLILLDIGLPAGSGLVVMKRIALLGSVAFTPIIIVTASNNSETKKRALENGAVGYFEKPYDFDKLLQKIESVVGVPEMHEQTTEN